MLLCAAVDGTTCQGVGGDNVSEVRSDGDLFGMLRRLRLCIHRVQHVRRNHGSLKTATYFSVLQTLIRFSYA